MNNNIKYTSKELLEFYSCNRDTWDEFYPSEKWVFDKIAGIDKKIGNVLDVGCACGGLGAALKERFVLNSYTGVDINKKSIEWAKDNRNLGDVPASFMAGDVLELNLRSQYDLVVSLSCADWNIETEKIIGASWEKVREGGHFVISLRLTDGKGVNNILKSYQYINLSGKEKSPEIANYVVFNFKDIIDMFKRLIPVPVSIGAYGYWGKPSSTAVTMFDRLVFAVFYIKKSSGVFNAEIKTEFNLPKEINEK